MKMQYHLLPLAAIVCATAPAAVPGTVEKFEQARLEYDALHTLLRIKAALADKEDELMPPVNRELFLQGFRKQLSSEKEFPFARLREHAKERQRYIDEQIQAADFLSPHAAQQGVTVLPNGLQYAACSLPDTEQNYRARRAHCLSASIPGTRLALPLSGTPTAVDDALYDAPRGIAWQFLLPINLLDEVDAKPLRKNGLHTVEIIATRESLSNELQKQARAYFAAKEPALPIITLENDELHAERSMLMGMLAAYVIDEPSELLVARVEKLLPRLDTPSEELNEELELAETNYWKAREELRRMQHRQIAKEIMQLQQQVPGTRVLSNGLLCRTIADSSGDIPLTNARYIEEEELGTEMYLRVQNRIINAANDLPSCILDVLSEIPEGAAWEIILPPTLRGKGYELPLLYRIRAFKPQQKSSAPILRDTI